MVIDVLVTSEILYFFQIYRTVSVQEKPGELTMKLNTFLSAMGEGGGGTLNPKPVFSEICRK